jgi:hypothetical protein
MRLASEADLDKFEYFALCLQCAYNNFPEDTTCGVLFGTVVTASYVNIIHIIRAVFEKIDIL